MSWTLKLRRRVRLLLWRERVEREMADEMRFHLAMEAEDHVRGGADARDASRQAHRAFGGVERYKDDARDARGGSWMEHALQDLRYAARVLRRAPGYSAVAILTLALGIGASAAVFSVVNGVLLHPLPYAGSDRLVALASAMRAGDAAVSPRDFLDWRADAKSFSGLAAAFTSTVNLTGTSEPERLFQARVTSNFFDVLGVRAERGRGFLPGEDEIESPRVVVVSEGLWRRRFGADPGIIGRQITLDGFPTTVVGVAPASVAWPERVDLWLTTRFTQRDVSPVARGARWISVIGRLAPGATLASSRAEMTTIASRIERLDPKHNTDVGVHATPLLDSMVGSLRRPLFILLGAVALVLLVACANVASLTLARTASRDGEIAVRTALGAGRGRVVRQLMTESLLLSLIGGAVGVAIASSGVGALVALAPFDLARRQDIRLDPVVLLFSFLVTLFCGALVGLMPAMVTSTRNVHARLRAAGRDGRGSGRSRLRALLVVAEVALSLVLLAGAGLLLRSFATLRNVDPGFRADDVVTFSLTMSPVKQETQAQQQQFASQLLQGVRRVPGVKSAALTFGLPLSNGSFGLTFEIQGRPTPPGPREPRAQVRVASQDFFRTLGIPLVRGRSFDARDRAGAEPVVLISAETARRFWPNEDPIGQRIQTGWSRDGTSKFGGIVVGIVGDVRQFSLELGVTPLVYMPYEQWPLDEVTVVARAPGATSGVLASAQGIVRSLDADLPVYDALTLRDLVASSMSQRTFYLVLLIAFSGVAVLLAVVGVYGVLAYAVEQRRREIGIRMALGATAASVGAMVLQQGTRLVLLGIALGLVGTLGVSRVLRSLLFEISPTDPATLIAAPLILLAVTTLASSVPARRAVRQDPLLAIRGED